MADHTHNEPNVTREREVIVTDGRRDGGFGGTLVAIIGILVVLLVGYFAIQAIGGSDGGSVVPDNVDVNITDNTGGGE